MINILILTVIAHVVIAALAVVFRPKDHGEYEPLFKFSEYSIIEDINGVRVDVSMSIDSVTHAMLKHLQDEFNIPSHEIAPNPDLSDYSEQRKKMIEEMMPPDYRKAFDLCLSDLEAKETKGNLNL